MTALNEYTYLSANGKSNIYTRELSPQDAPRGIIQICHGLAEHIVRYDEFAEFLCSHGFLVAGNDHLGHGRTAMESGDFGFISEFRGWDMAVYDVRKLTELLSGRYPDVPVFLFGHSMGSFLARTYMIRYKTGLDGVMLSGTGHQPRPLLNAGLSIVRVEEKMRGSRYHSKPITKITSDFRNRPEWEGGRHDWVTRDKSVADAYSKDELSGHNPTISMMRDIFWGMKYNSQGKNLKKMNKDVPVYMFSGERDPIGMYGRGVMKTYELFLSVGMKDVTMKLYPEGRHEMLNELNKDEVYADVHNWIESKMKAAREK